MNFRTTSILLCILAAGVAFLAYDKFRSVGTGESGNPVDAEGRKLVDMRVDAIDRLVLRPADGQPIELVKKDRKWSMTSPINAGADTFAADQLVSAVLDLKSR